MVTELDADTEEIRLRRLDEAAKQYPRAIALEKARAQLDIARALAANSRTIIQASNSSDLVRDCELRRHVSGAEQRRAGS